MVWALARRRRRFRKAKIRRLIFLGLDGLDPRLTERFMAEGKLPNLARLREKGSFHRLRTTFPALSPVAWSTFATGVSPAKHNIFDFLNRSLISYVPELSSSKVRPATRALSVGRCGFPWRGPRWRCAARAESFWKILGEQLHRQHHPARAHHVSARGIRRPDALRHVYARPARDAGQLLAIHHPAERADARGRQPLSLAARRQVPGGIARRAR